jgi:hypothetical protein
MRSDLWRHGIIPWTLYLFRKRKTGEQYGQWLLFVTVHRYTKHAPFHFASDWGTWLSPWRRSCQLLSWSRNSLPFMEYSIDDSVQWLRDGKDDQMIGVSFPSGKTELSLLYNIQTGYNVQDKAAGASDWSMNASVPSLRMRGSIPSWPPLWSRGQSSWLQIQRSRIRFPGATRFSEK